MNKPITALQFAVILWGPVLAVLALWALVTSFSEQQSAATARNRETQKAMIETTRTGAQLQRDLDALNEQLAPDRAR